MANAVLLASTWVVLELTCSLVWWAVKLWSYPSFLKPDEVAPFQSGNTALQNWLKVWKSLKRQTTLKSPFWLGSLPGFLPFMLILLTLICSFLYPRKISVFERKAIEKKTSGKMVWVERGLKDHLAPSPLHWAEDLQLGVLMRQKVTECNSVLDV